MDILFCIIIGACIVSLWAVVIIAKRRQNKQISAGYLVSSAGTTLISIGLLLNSFELVSHKVYIAVVAIGIIFQVVALFLVLKQKLL